MQTVSKSFDPWMVFEYELLMYFRTRRLLVKYFRNKRGYSSLRNAIVESTLLHTRIILDIITERKKGDDDEILLEQLIPGWRKNTSLNRLVEELLSNYGSSNKINSPCWQLNKMLAHASRMRGSQHEYLKLIISLDKLIVPIVKKISEIANRLELMDIINYYSSRIVLGILIGTEPEVNTATRSSIIFHRKINP